jgi:hypothetical protein
LIEKKRSTGKPFLGRFACERPDPGRPTTVTLEPAEHQNTFGKDELGKKLSVYNLI